MAVFLTFSEPAMPAHNVLRAKETSFTRQILFVSSPTRALLLVHGGTSTYYKDDPLIIGLAIFFKYYSSSQYVEYLCVPPIFGAPIHVEPFFQVQLY